MTSIILFEKNSILLTYLKINFQKSEGFNIVATCHTEEELREHLEQKEPDVLLIAHQGGIHIDTVVNVSKNYPSIQQIAVRFDEVIFKRCIPNKKAISYEPIKIKHLEEVLQPLDPVYFFQ